MNRINKWMLTGCFFISSVVAAQELPEQQLENLAAETETVTEDDQSLQDLDHLKQHPVNLNEAEADALRQLTMLSELQIQSFLQYRRLAGRLLDMYELQAVPGWEPAVIRQLLPFVRIGAATTMAAETGKRFREGEHQLLFRMGRTLGQSADYRKPITENGFQGSPWQMMLRYTYRFKNNLQYGIVGDKDAGESFFRRGQKTGFDFYSLHLFARRLGIIQSLAVGDFTVNFGQGLIQWQSLAFKKSAIITAIKRQSAVLRPYHSAGEFNFHRGVGITLKKARLESTFFISLRKLSSNSNVDTTSGIAYISSILSGGYHRNTSELEDRQNLQQLAMGGNIQYRLSNGHIGLNAVQYRYGLPVEKRPEPYNLYTWRGRVWSNASADYSYTWRNIHLFGEAAMDKGRHWGFLNGLLLSADPRIDLSILYRRISPRYQSVQGNAFTESTMPTNESGFFTGISIRPLSGWKMDAYFDFYRFPWLRYRQDAPGGGRDLVFQLTYTPNRESQLMSRFRRELRTGNEPGDTAVLHATNLIARESWRTQLNYKLSPWLTARTRVELVWYDRGGVAAESGFLGLLDLIYKPLMKPWSGGIRLQYGETDGYNSRVYAYENDVLYSYSIPAFSGKGYRYYLNLQWDWGKRLSFWAKWAQTIFWEKKYVSGAEEVLPEGADSGFKIQFRYIFQ
jgi:hypothetical protein